MEYSLVIFTYAFMTGVFGMKFPFLHIRINAFHVTKFDRCVTFKFFTSILFHCVRVMPLYHCMSM